MCVCGLPTQTAAHAERMADFALGMFAAVEKACHITGAQLQIRVGMHSGTVTAGVLLGERSRFQLFGDTVNTASRSALLRLTILFFSRTLPIAACATYSLARLDRAQWRARGRRGACR